MMKFIKNALGHTRNIITHKWWVFYYACKLGIPFRGFMHDWSKFSPIEFFEGVKYYQGSSNPIPACKEANGYSLAWQHHKGHNPHHYEYWIDNVDNGGTPIKIPYKYVLEMIADYLAAGKTYQGKNFSFKSEYEWWKSQRQLRNMHEDTKMLLDIVFGYLMMYGFDDDLIYFANEHIYTNEHSLKTYHKHMEFSLRKNNFI